MTAFRHKPWYAGLDSTPGLQWAVSLRYHGIPCHLVAFHGTRTVPRRVSLWWPPISTRWSGCCLAWWLWSAGDLRGCSMLGAPGGPWGYCRYMQMPWNLLKTTGKHGKSSFSWFFDGYSLVVAREPIFSQILGWSWCLSCPARITGTVSNWGFLSHGGTVPPYKSSIYRWIFHEINHPAIQLLGYPDVWKHP